MNSITKKEEKAQRKAWKKAACKIAGTDIDKLVLDHKLLMADHKELVRKSKVRLVLLIAMGVVNFGLITIILLVLGV